MKKYAYSGYIELDSKVLLGMLETLLYNGELKERYASGVEYQIVYKSDHQSVLFYQDKEDTFLFDGDFIGSSDDFNSFLNDFKTKLIDFKASFYEIGWNELDENDKITGEDFVVKSE